MQLVVHAQMRMPHLKRNSTIFSIKLALMFQHVDAAKQLHGICRSWRRWKLRRERVGVFDGESTDNTVGSRDTASQLHVDIKRASSRANSTSTSLQLSLQYVRAFSAVGRVGRHLLEKYAFCPWNAVMRAMSNLDFRSSNVKSLSNGILISMQRQRAVQRLAIAFDIDFITIVEVDLVRKR